MARGIAALIGLLLVTIGALGLVDNPLVGEHGLFAASPLLDLANLAIGTAAVGLSFARREQDVRRGLVGLGIAAIVLVAVLIADPSIAAVLAPPANPIDELVYATVGLVALGVGVLARTTTREADVADEW